MPDPVEEAFRIFYRGRHDPADAWWWLEHPADPAPSGTMPTQYLFLAAADELAERGALAAADALRRSLGDLLEHDGRTTDEALTRARRHLEDVPVHRRH